MELLKSDFYYDLPEELIAQTPIEPRNASRMMCVDRTSGAITHDHFYNLCDHLKEGDLLVMNDSRVIPARLYGEREGTGGQVEVLLLKRNEGDVWDFYAWKRVPTACMPIGVILTIAAAGSDITELTASIMRALTCDSKIMKKIALDIHEFTNTVSGMKEIAESDYKADVLGGQNPVPIYLEVAQQLTQTHTTSYDDDLDMGFQVSMQDYFAGRVTLDDAIELFKKAAVARYEELAEEEEEEE